MITLVTNGAYDVLNCNHKAFISSLIKLINPDKILILLSSDYRAYEDAYKSKSIFRPLFSYEWREEDLANWLAAFYPHLQVEITKARENMVEELSFYLNKSSYIIGTNSKYSYLKGSNIVTRSKVVSQANVDIISTITECNYQSLCNLVRGGSVLVRDGEVIKSASSGVVARDNSTEDCPKCNGYLNSKCSYYFPEELLLEGMQLGDDIISTYNPTLSVSKKLVELGVRRVVYLYTHINSDGINYLIDKNIPIRKAGS